MNTPPTGTPAETPAESGELERPEDYTEPDIPEGRMALVVAVDGSMRRVSLGATDREGESLNVLQREVGGTVDVVSLADDLDMWVHDEGWLIGLDLNVIASLIAGMFDHGHALYVGPAVFTGGVDDEGYSLGLSTEDADRIAGAVRDLREHG